jgi:hypothetical protein
VWYPVHPVSRVCFAGFGVGLAIVATSAIVATDAGTLQRVGGFMGLAFGLVTLVRAPRMGVLLDAERLTIRGWFRTRTVPRASVVAVSDPIWLWPAVHWLDLRGRRRRSPILMFARSTRYDWEERYNARMRANLNRALGLCEQPRRSRPRPPVRLQKTTSRRRRRRT